MADGLRWNGGGGYLYTEKKDGVFAVRQMLGAIFVGEAMRDGSFWAFDVVRIGGDDIARLPLREHWSALLPFAEDGLQIVPA